MEGEGRGRGREGSRHSKVFMAGGGAGGGCRPVRQSCRTGVRPAGPARIEG